MGKNIGTGIGMTYLAALSVENWAIQRCCYAVNGVRNFFGRQALKNTSEAAFSVASKEAIPLTENAVVQAVQKDISFNFSAESVNAAVNLNEDLLLKKLRVVMLLQNMQLSLVLQLLHRWLCILKRSCRIHPWYVSFQMDVSVFGMILARAVVIRNSSAIDGGTVFIPNNGIDYFLNGIH